MRILSLYTFYCPSCNHRLAYRDTSRLKRRGNPLLHCPKCNQTCIDPFTSEPAFKPYRANSNTQLLLISLIHTLIVSFFAIAIWALTLAPYADSLIIPVGIFLFFWLGFFLYHKKTRNRIRLKKWQESDRRLHDSAYAEALANFGFSVPAQYLPPDFKRISSSMPYKVVLIQKPASFHKHPGPRPNHIDAWHPGRD